MNFRRNFARACPKPRKDSNARVASGLLPRTASLPLITYTHLYAFDAPRQRVCLSFALCLRVLNADRDAPLCGRAYACGQSMACRWDVTDIIGLLYTYTRVYTLSEGYLPAGGGEKVNRDRDTRR